MAGHNNWIDIDSSTDTMQCSMDFSTLQILSKTEAIDYNVEQIIKKYDNLYVCLSGGLDSEFAAKSLLERGVSFTPVIVDFGLNSSEVWWAYYWCYKNKIKPKIIDLSVNYMVNVLPALFKKYHGSVVSMIDYIIEFELRSVCGHMILGGGEPFMRLHADKDKVTGGTGDNFSFCSYDFNLDITYPNKHPSGFVCYTPELYFSLIRDFDYTKPAQIALSEYYGVSPRPKISHDYHKNQLMHNLLATLQKPIYMFSLGNRYEFLIKSRNKQKINLTPYLE